ncbi:MAG TPA: hypothetical protein VIU11_18550 [Nakamurella sp.]
MTLGPIDHLTLDAVVAYADGEMAMVSFQRAAAHVAQCPQCDAEVRAQLVARSWLRSAEAPAMPTSLLDALRSIPVALPATDSVRATDSLRRTDDYPGTGRRTGGGHDVVPQHQRGAQRSRRFRFLGTGALVAGLTMGVLVGAEPAVEPDGHPDGPQVAHISPATANPVATAGWGTP